MTTPSSRARRAGDGKGEPSPASTPTAGAVLGTLPSSERGNERSFHELHVRSETGLGAEKAVALH
jgi:hypothetical protein